MGNSESVDTDQIKQLPDGGIELPISIEKSQEYGGDIRTMSGGWENGFWLDRFDVLDADGNQLARLKDASVAEHIAKVLNEYPALVSELDRKTWALDSIRDYIADLDTAGVLSGTSIAEAMRTMLEKGNASSKK